MEKKTCKICGKSFTAFKPEFDTCPNCKKGKTPNVKGGKTLADIRSGQYRGGPPPGGQQRSHPSGGSHPQGGGQRSPGQSDVTLAPHLLLNSFYEGDNLRREVFRDIPEQIAQIFDQAGMKSTSVRRFYNVVRLAYDKYRFSADREFAASRELIQSLDHLATYNQTREVTKPCFTKFIKHYIELAEKSPENLRGFKLLFESVIGFMPKK
ncbi:MAG: type III-A CRISPR-associated protein Csm2 [bacterium]